MRAVLALLLLSTTARADVMNEASLGSHIRALRSDSANAITGKSLAGPTFAYARRLPVQLAPKLALWGTASFLAGFVDDTMFQTLDTRLSMLQPAVGVRAMYPLWRRYVFASARLDAGVKRASVRMEDAAGHTASDAGWGGMSTAALGIDLTPLSLAAFQLGMRFELGYVATTGIDLTAKSDGPADEDTLELDRMAASLGSLDIGGRYFAVTLEARF